MTPLRSRTVRLDPEVDPLELAGATGFAWSAPSGALAGLGAAARVPVGTGAGRIERAAEAVAALLATAEVDDPDGSGLGPVAVGALPFHAGSPGELVVPALLVRRGPDGLGWVTTSAHGPPPQAAELLARLRPEGVRERLPGQAGGVPERRPGQAGWAQGRLPGEAGWARGTPGGFAGPAGEPPWPAGRRLDGRSAARHAWRAAVTGALQEIAAGRLDKVVLAREALVEADRPFPRAALLRRLRARAAGTLLYASGGFLGASPELLVSRRGATAVSRPMAGTAPLGATAAAEADDLARLAGSPKEAVEHRLVVDAVAEGLAKVADRVEVGHPEVVRLTTVAHLASEVTAALTEPLPSALELAGLLQPTPAVAGTPRDAALAVIAALEPFDRGRYAGPVGWVDAAGDGEWAVALRCAELHGRRARLLAGAGIVVGSDPDAEWAETEHKLAAMLEVLLGG
jgi:menaquinone-specific isochorismate synthase